MEVEAFGKFVCLFLVECLSLGTPVWDRVILGLGLGLDKNKVSIISKISDSSLIC